MKISHFIELYRNFGPKIALSAAMASSFKRAVPLKQRRILSYLKENYSGFISSYKSETSSQAKNSGIIWTMWWQGEENAPETVKKCLASVRSHKGAHPLKVITKDNFHDYIKLPDYILEKVNSGAITLTHFSDIVRFYLLHEYGGLWLDATIFVTSGIPENIFELDYYTIRLPFTQGKHSLVKNRWTGFLQASRKGGLLCKFVLNFFLEYWKTQQCLIDYFLLDYAVYIACTEFPECREILDSVPMVNCDIYRLGNLLNETWDLETFHAIERDTHFSKLTYKRKFYKRKFGHETFYGHLFAGEDSPG